MTADGILPVVAPDAQSKTLRQILIQILGVSYAYWLLEYRRVATWRYSAWIAQGMWPGRLLAEYPYLTSCDRLLIWPFYTAVTLTGLLIPQKLFQLSKERLADGVRSLQQRKCNRTE